METIKHHIGQRETSSINVLNLCSGINTTAEAMKQLKVRVRHHFDVELDPTARSIASLHHKSRHDLPQDINHITKHHIQQLMNTNPIHLVTISTPCQGLSRRNTTGRGLKDPRSGLLIKAIDILDWVKEINPAVEYIIENVDFKLSHKEDYQYVCGRLGHAATAQNAKQCSASSRPRLFWTNVPQEQHDPEPVDANGLLAPAKLAGGAQQAPCLMASWTCTKCRSEECRDEHNHAEHHRMNTGNPVLVDDNGTIRHLQPMEGEAIMGLPPNYTAIGEEGGQLRPISDIRRMKCLGGAIDVRHLRRLLANVAQRQLQQVQDSVKPHTGWNTEAIASWLTEGPLPIADEAGTWTEAAYMHGTKDFVRACTQGFDLRFEGDRQKTVEAPNGSTCEKRPEATQKLLDKELAAGRILGPYDNPPLQGFKVVPRGLKPEATKDRPISCANRPAGESVNDGIPKLEHIQLPRIQDFDQQIRQCYQRTGEVWVAKADVANAYRTCPVRPEDWHLQGIKWKGKYYIDTRLSFGTRSSVDQWLRIANAMAWSMHRWGAPIFIYMDDAIIIGASRQECTEKLRKFREMCAHWGLDLKDMPDAEPAREMTLLGIQYDLRSMTRKITDKRREQLVEELQRAQQTRSRAHWEHMVGVLWFVIRCIPRAKPRLQPLTAVATAARYRGHSQIRRSPELDDHLEWWIDFLQTMDKNNWHGERILQLATVEATIACGDAGSEWGFGGFDGEHYFHAQWTPQMWHAVQRSKGPSSLHMEALQTLVAARALGSTWEHKAVYMKLDSLALVQVLKKGRHQYPPMNDILQELQELQMHHNFDLVPVWVRRDRNEAADALSKDDMGRFFDNVEGDRTMIALQPQHTAAAGRPRAGMRRSTRKGKQPESRPTKPAYQLPANITSAAQLQRTLAEAVRTCEDTMEEARQTAGVKHYLRFCERAGYAADVAPELESMRQRVLQWMADAPVTYRHGNKLKRGIVTSSITTYTSELDAWYTKVANQPKGALSRHGPISMQLKFIKARWQSGERQVHGIDYEQLDALCDRVKKYGQEIACMLIAAYTLAFFALLRPGEYMLTPRYPEFDESRHARACDITFYRGEEQCSFYERPTSYTLNIKQSKQDSLRLGATVEVGGTGKPHCPVEAMATYFQTLQPRAGGPLFTTEEGAYLQYHSMLRVLRANIPVEPHLYGLHSFRVGGAQALAKAGRPVFYIMARGRWRTSESVARYVEAPREALQSDAAAMAKTRQEQQLQRCRKPDRWGEAWLTHPEGGGVLPQVHPNTSRN